MTREEAANLIAAMIVNGAEEEEIFRATKYSQAVINAEKSMIEAYNIYNISELREKYIRLGGVNKKE